MSANSKSGLHCELTQLALAAGLTLVSANVLAQSAPATNTLSTVTVTGDRTAASTTVTVTGHSVRLVPFMDVTVSQSATLPVERYTR